MTRQEIQKYVGQATLMIQAGLSASRVCFRTLESGQVMQLGIGQNCRERLADFFRMDQVVTGDDARGYRNGPYAFNRHADHGHVRTVEEELTPPLHGLDKFRGLE